MIERADAHIHLFEGGYRESFTGRSGVNIDEVACYASLAESYNIKRALIVAYGAVSWCKNNNAFLARINQEHDWVCPTAYVEPTDPPLTVEDLQRYKSQGFVGLSFYTKPSLAQSEQAVGRISDATWQWLVEHRWLVSANARSPQWQVWHPILERHGELRVVICHVGLPRKVKTAPSTAQARAALADVLQLAPYPGPRIKISCLYSITDPGYAYPHEAAWPYIEQVAADFGVGRMLWASDYVPCLDSISFPQTFEVLNHLPFLTGEDRRNIQGAHLRKLLDEVE